MKIKIRAWDRVRKVMIDDLICFYPPNDEENSANEWRISHSNEFNSSNSPFHGYMWNIRNLIPMLFTGLRDKNKKEIYEGDILGNEDTGERPNVVKFEHGAFTCSSGEFVSYKRDIKSTVIIGNIYENPKLHLQIEVNNERKI